MKTTYIALIFALANSLGSCKIKRQDTQIGFKISFKPGKDTSNTGFCFDELHAVGQSELTTKCIDSLHQSIILPVNISTDSTAYIFRQGEKKDTLVLNYTLVVKDYNGEYTMEAQKFRLGHCTFDSIQVKQKNVTELKNEARDIESITIYY